MFVTVAVLPTPPFCEATEMIRAVLVLVAVLVGLECLANDNNPFLKYFLV